MAYERILDKAHRPTDQEMLDTIQETTQWLRLREYLAAAYGVTPELINYGKYGWTFRYRKGGRTLCSLYPERGAFSILIVLGKKEVEKALSMMGQFNANIRTVLDETPQLHDGRWLWLRVLEQSDVDGIIELLTLKRKPKRLSTV